MGPAFAWGRGSGMYIVCDWSDGWRAVLLLGENALQQAPCSLLQRALLLRRELQAWVIMGHTRSTGLLFHAKLLTCVHYIDFRTDAGQHCAQTR